tara:strand:+ start:1122 stop:1916 length:795 start_codon:yes stop_codon:yes gene_type:complete
MGIIETTREHQQYLSGTYRASKDAKDEATEAAKILDLSVLRDYVNKVCEHHRCKEEVPEKYRKWSYVFEWPVANVLGRVDDAGWVYMIEAAIDWAIECREGVQPNGRWKVWAHECALEQRLHTRRTTVGKDADGRPQVQEQRVPVDTLVLGLQFVDTTGNKDLVYDMGRPTTRKEQGFDADTVKEMMSGLTGRSVQPEVAASLSEEAQKQMEAQATRIAEQDALIAEMKTEQSKTNDMLAALVLEMKSQRGGDSTVKRRSKASK